MVNVSNIDGVNVGNAAKHRVSDVTNLASASDIRESPIHPMSTMVTDNLLGSRNTRMLVLL